MTLSRETRSGRIFGDWAGPYVTTANPHLNVADLLKETIRFQDEASPCDDLFDLSPLSSPESTPPGSPNLQTTPFPEYYDTDDLEDPDGKWECHADSSGISQKLAHVSSATLDDLFADGSKSGPVSEAKVKRGKRKKNQSKKNRKKRREENKGDRGTLFGETTAREQAKKKYLDHLQPLYTSTQTKEAPHVKTGYSGRNDKEHVLKTFTLDELVGENSTYKMVLFKWDGKTPTGLVDQEGRMFGIVAGHPTDSKWQKLAVWAAKCLEEARLRCRASTEACEGRRGKFTTLRCGVSHGGGQTHPKNLSNTKVNEEVLDWLNSQECFKRLAGFTSSVFSTYAPKLHDYYKEQLSALHNHDPSLKPTFPSTVFTATTYNLGPQTVCYPHIDFANLAFGWCAISALGSFDPKKGGHLILWECSLVIEFPPGSTVLIPSAFIHHSNTPISPTERRYSFTQYSAGALFRWVDHNFQKTEEYRKSLSREALQELDEKNKNRWAYGLSLFPRLPSVSTS